MLDPLTHVVQNDSVWILLSKFGIEKVKAMFNEERYIVASQFRGKIPTLSVKKSIKAKR